MGVNHLLLTIITDHYNPQLLQTLNQLDSEGRLAEAMGVKLDDLPVDAEVEFSATTVMEAPEGDRMLLCYPGTSTIKLSLSDHAEPQVFELDYTEADLPWRIAAVTLLYFPHRVSTYYTLSEESEITRLFQEAGVPYKLCWTSF